MIMGGDVINEVIIIFCFGYCMVLISCVGDDVSGYFIVDYCWWENIDIQSLKQDVDIDIFINVGLVIVDGECIFVINCNGSLWKLNINDVDLDCFLQVKVLLLVSIFNSLLFDGKVLMEIFMQVKVYWLIICVDMIKFCFNEMLEDICYVLSYVDYLFFNFEEVRFFIGKEMLDEIVDSFFDCGVKMVVIKIGKRGCFIKCVDMKMEVFVVLGIIVIDIIGVGDNFVLGFIFVLFEGKLLCECVLFVNVMVVILVLSVGVIMGVKNRKLVE